MTFQIDITAYLWLFPASPGSFPATAAEDFTAVSAASGQGRI